MVYGACNSSHIRLIKVQLINIYALAVFYRMYLSDFSLLLLFYIYWCNSTSQGSLKRVLVSGRRHAV